MAKPKAAPKKDIPAPAKVPDARHHSAEEVQRLIVEYSKQHGIGSAAPLCIARLESGFNPRAANPRSSAKGVFQYLDGTWKATDEGRAGYSVFDADKNIKAAVKYMAIHKKTTPWVVANKCPKLQEIQKADS